MYSCFEHGSGILTLTIPTTTDKAGIFLPRHHKASLREVFLELRSCA